MSPRDVTASFAPDRVFQPKAIGIAESSPPSVEALPPKTRLLYCNTGDERYSPRAANLAHTPHPSSTVNIRTDNSPKIAAITCSACSRGSVSSQVKLC